MVTKENFHNSTNSISEQSYVYSVCLSAPLTLPSFYFFFINKIPAKLPRYLINKKVRTHWLGTQLLWKALEKKLNDFAEVEERRRTQVILLHWTISFTILDLTSAQYYSELHSGYIQHIIIYHIYITCHRIESSGFHNDKWYI